MVIPKSKIFNKHMEIKKIIRSWKVGLKNNILITQKAKIKLNTNEQISFYSNDLNKIENEICKKSWGYYLTPSIDKRLKKYGQKVFIMKNSKKNSYLVIVNNSKLREFKKYCNDEKQKYFLLKN